MRAPAVAWLVLASTAATADPSSEARRLYIDGQAAFDLGHYDDALAAWQRSYELSNATGLLYNLAQAYRLRSQAGDCVEARRDYQLFAQQSVPSPQRAMAEQYIDELTTCSNVTPANTVAPLPAHGSKRELELAVAAGASGLVLLSFGAYFGHRAGQLGEDVTSACAVSCSWSTVKAEDAAGRRDATVGRTFDVLGALAVAGGAVLGVFSYRDGEFKMEPVASPHQAGAALTWSRTW